MLDRKLLTALAILAVAQIIGWGGVGVLAVLADEIAVALSMPLPAIFAGPSLMFALMGVLSPMLTLPMQRLGVGVVMAAGAGIGATGLIGLALANGPASFFAAWTVIGVAGAASLTTPANILVNQLAGADSRRAIGLLALGTGLSGTIFLPLIAWLESLGDWRSAILACSALMLVVAVPSYLFLGRQVKTTAPGAAGASSNKDRSSNRQGSPVFLLLVAAISLNGFVTFGLNAVLVQLLVAFGLADGFAIALASSLGILQVLARALEMSIGRHWDGLATALVSTPLMIIGLGLLGSSGADWSMVAFIVVYGLGSGALAVARSTMPLVFYDGADFARASVRIALPLNLLLAVSPAIMAGALEQLGPRALPVLAIICSLGALICLMVLHRLRPQASSPLPSGERSARSAG